MSPPVQDSAVATVRPSSSPATCSSTVDPSVEKSVAACRRSIRPSSAVHAASDAGSWRTTTSTSPRRRQVVISRSSKPSISASAARSVSAISDSGIPNSRSIDCVNCARGADRGTERLRLHGLLPHRVQLPGRPRQDHHRGTAAAVGRGDDHAGRGARRLDHRRALRHQRLLAVGRPHGLEVEVAPALHERPQDVRDPALEVLIEVEWAAGEAGRPSPASGRPRSGRARRW